MCWQRCRGLSSGGAPSGDTRIRRPLARQPEAYRSEGEVSSAGRGMGEKGYMQLRKTMPFFSGRTISSAEVSRLGCFPRSPLPKEISLLDSCLYCPQRKPEFRQNANLKFFLKKSLTKRQNRIIMRVYKVYKSKVYKSDEGKLHALESCREPWVGATRWRERCHLIPERPTERMCGVRTAGRKDGAPPLPEIGMRCMPPSGCLPAQCTRWISTRVVPRAFPSLRRRRFFVFPHSDMMSLKRKDI